MFSADQLTDKHNNNCRHVSIFVIPQSSAATGQLVRLCVHVIAA